MTGARPFATLKITEKSGESATLVASFSSHTLNVLANSMLDQDISDIEFLGGLLRVTVTKSLKSKTAEIIGE